MSINLNELAKGGTFCLAKAGLAAGSTTTQIAIAAPNGAGVDYCIAGEIYHKKDAASVAYGSAPIQPALTTCLYLICLDSAGTISCVKGEAVLNADLTAGTKVLQWPTPSASVCPIGGFKVVLTGAATFTAGTSDFATAGVTDTWFDLFAVPTAPLTA